MFLYSTRDFAETISIVADIEPVAYNRSHYYNTNRIRRWFFSRSMRRTDVCKSFISIGEFGYRNHFSRVANPGFFIIDFSIVYFDGRVLQLFCV